MRLKSNFPILFLCLVLLWLPSCKKSDSSKPKPVIVNTWTFKGQTINAGYSDIISKKGFTLIFHEEANSQANQELKFIFPAHPLVADQSFLAALDTNKSMNVMVQLLNDKGSYHSIDGDTSKVRTSIFNNKIYLTGFNLILKSDSATGDRAVLSFNLTEF